MLASSSTVAPKPAVAMPPAAQPSLPANSAGSAPQFAQFLTSQAAPPAPPAHTDPEPSQPEAAAPAAPTPRRATAQPAKLAAQKPAGDATAKADAKTESADKTDAAKAGDAVSPDDDDTTETPELKEFTQLIGMNAAQPDTAAAVAKPDLHRTRTAATADDDGTAGRTTLQAASDKGRATDKPDTAAAKPGDLRAAADKVATRASANADQPQATSALQAGPDQPAAAPAPAAAPTFAAALVQAMPTANATPEAAPTTTYAHVQAPVHGNAFAPELGARVSLLAVDGVQQAELQLNPADMGPVSVQITVDGNQAQVSFHALQAETRQALEQSLPDLAAALQGQGLTLSGGGVFQQAQRDADHGDDRPGNAGTSRSSRSGNDRVGGTANVAAAPVRRTVGLVDTFA